MPLSDSVWEGINFSFTIAGWCWGSAGSDAIIHSVNHIVHDESIPSNSKWILLLDFSNAFNSIDRRSVLEEIRLRVPSLSAWFESCYGTTFFFWKSNYF